MKKFILALIVCLSITSLTFANGVCNIHGEFIGNSCPYCDIATAAKDSKKYIEAIEDAMTVGESAGVISGYAMNSDSFNEFADNIAEHEFQSESLQTAQEIGKKIGDVVADVYIWATSDN